jgi:hypothetical protein
MIRSYAKGDLPESVAEGVAELDVGAELVAVADNPRWVFSKSLKTRSLAASIARFFSSSASAFKAASLVFCFLISRLCVTSKYQHWEIRSVCGTLEQSQWARKDDRRTQIRKNAFSAE